MRFFLYEIVARIVAIYLCFDCSRKLRQHLEGIVMLMKYSPDWRVFMERVDKEYPRWGANYLLPFPDDYIPPNDEAAN